MRRKSQEKRQNKQVSLPVETSEGWVYLEAPCGNAISVEDHRHVMGYDNSSPMPPEPHREECTPTRPSISAWQRILVTEYHERVDVHERFTTVHPEYPLDDIAEVPDEVTPEPQEERHQHKVVPVTFIHEAMPFTSATVLVMAMTSQLGHHADPAMDKWLGFAILAAPLVLMLNGIVRQKSANQITW